MTNLFGQIVPGKIGGDRKVEINEDFKRRINVTRILKSSAEYTTAQSVSRLFVEYGRL